MSNLQIEKITRPKIARNKYDYINYGGNNVVATGGSSGSSSGGSSGGGGSSVTYDVFVGATSVTNGSSGLVPAPLAGEQGFFLQGDGTWSELYDGHISIDEDGNIVFDTSVFGTSAIFEYINSSLIESNVINSSISNSSTGNIRILNSSTINASTGNIHDINSSVIDVNLLNGLQAYITNLNSENIETKNLTVTGLAHFFELIIDQIRATQGNILVTPVSGFVIEDFEETADGYMLFWSAKDDEGRTTYNNWLIGDQALCQSFNKASVGTTYNVSNVYWWALVIDCGTDTTTNQHWIEISKTTYDGTISLESGLEVVMLGHRQQEGETLDEDRQNAIYISAYNSLDSTLDAPFLCYYKGIDDFNLSNHKYTYFASNGNLIVGNLVVESNNTSVEDLIDDLNKNSTFVIQITSSCGNFLQKGENSFTLTAKCFWKNEDVTSNISSSYFNWFRYTANADEEQQEIDLQYSEDYLQGIGNVLTLTKDDIDIQADFACTVNIEPLINQGILS